MLRKTVVRFSVALAVLVLLALPVLAQGGTGGGDSGVWKLGLGAEAPAVLPVTGAFGLDRSVTDWLDSAPNSAIIIEAPYGLDRSVTDWLNAAPTVGDSIDSFDHRAPYEVALEQVDASAFGLSGWASPSALPTTGVTDLLNADGHAPYEFALNLLTLPVTRSFAEPDISYLTFSVPAAPLDWMTEVEGYLR